MRRAGGGHRGDPLRDGLAEREPFLGPGNHASEQEKEAGRSGASKSRAPRLPVAAPPAVRPSAMWHR